MSRTVNTFGRSGKRVLDTNDWDSLFGGRDGECGAGIVWSTALSRRRDIRTGRLLQLHGLWQFV